METGKDVKTHAVQVHKYAIHFDILPEISYLTLEFPLLIVDLLPILHGFPQGVELAEKSVDEGLDFCRVIFEARAASPDALKNFTNWFQAIFREQAVSDLLERLVLGALDTPDTDAAIEVLLTDWTRLAN